jgi:hypothetical protein
MCCMDYWRQTNSIHIKLPVYLYRYTNSIRRTVVYATGGKAYFPPARLCRARLRLKFPSVLGATPDFKRDPP